ncbi:hypothetical protein IKD98_03395 [Candidatus Saccharibacteria bacterium]|nr:hypothetical protein [Candidatus Saccharibacteria bacterium]
MKRKQKKMNKKHEAIVFGILAFAVFTTAMVLSVVAMRSTIDEIAETAISRTPDAILASAGVTDGKNVLLPVGYFDQRQEPCVDMYNLDLKNELYNREFEWVSCEYYNNGFEQGLVSYDLNDDLLPVGVGGQLTPNRGLKDMSYWFTAVDGKNKSYYGNLEMSYSKNNAEFSFYSEDFYPLDEATFSDGDSVNVDGHNHLFTMNLAVPFTVLASGEESFEIVADDDTFVFVGDELAIDLGGIHEAMAGRLMINEEGEVYSGVGDEELAFSGVKVKKDEGSIIRIFHADRNSSESVFGVMFSEMNLGVVETKVADKKKSSEIQIAYDPTDPTYVAPLGESVVVKADGTRGYIIMATIEGIMVIAFAVFMVIAIKAVVKRKANK